MTRTTPLRTPTTRFGAPARPRRRSGVNLIELLVVIAIIGILMALVAAALHKTAEGQNRKSTQDQVFKLQQALDMEYERIVAKCDADARNGGIPPELVNYCEGNMARAKAIWTAYQLRLNFPETFAEAAVTVPLTDSSGRVIYVARQLSTFAPVQGLGTYTGASPFAANEESGALLYIILTQRSVGGSAMGNSGDDLTQASRRKVTFTLGGNTKELETFSDFYRSTIGFNRWRQDPVGAGAPVELEAPPYVDARVASATPRNTDPLDPQNLVFGWSDVYKRNLMNQPPPVSLLFNGRNRVANVYSLGSTKVDGAGNPTPLDDIVGYRLRQQGARGNIK